VVVVVVVVILVVVVVVGFFVVVFFLVVPIVVFATGDCILAVCVFACMTVVGGFLIHTIISVTTAARTRRSKHERIMNIFEQPPDLLREEEEFSNTRSAIA